MTLRDHLVNEWMNRFTKHTTVFFFWLPLLFLNLSLGFGRQLKGWHMSFACTSSKFHPGYFMVSRASIGVSNLADFQAPQSPIALHGSGPEHSAVRSASGVALVAPEHYLGARPKRKCQNIQMLNIESDQTDLIR